MRLGIIAGALMWVLVFVLTGCGSTQGWQFSIGVHPVTETAKTEKLNEKGK